MGLLSESDYTHTIQALEFYLENKQGMMTDQEKMEKQALLCWIKISKSKLGSWLHKTIIHIYAILSTYTTKTDG